MIWSLKVGFFYLWVNRLNIHDWFLKTALLSTAVELTAQDTYQLMSALINASLHFTVARGEIIESVHFVFGRLLHLWLQTFSTNFKMLWVLTISVRVTPLENIMGMMNPTHRKSLSSKSWSKAEINLLPVKVSYCILWLLYIGIMIMGLYWFPFS